MAYTTLAQVKTYLDITSSDDDDLFSDLITRAKATIDEYVGFAFEVSDSTEARSFGIHDTEGPYLYFDEKLAAISSVINNADAATPDTVASTNYITLPRNETPYYAIRLLDSADVTWDYANDPETAITVKGSWVWSESAPSDIEHAAVRLVAWVYRQRESQGQADRPIIAEGVTILPSEIPGDVRAILNRYRATTGQFIG